MKKYYLVLLTMILSALPLSMYAELKTWSFEWDKSKSDPTSQGFYNTGKTAVSKEYYTATLAGIEWNIASPETQKYAYTASSGQTIGLGAPATHVSLWTTKLGGKIHAVRVTARVNSSDNKATVEVKVNGKKYLSDNKEKTDLDKSLTTSDFKGDGEEGKIEIAIEQTSEAKSILYIKKIEIDYEPGDVVPEPVIPLKADFSTSFSGTSYLTQNFNSAEELTGWKYDEGWSLARKNFSPIDSHDQYSLFIKYDGGTGARTIESPEVTIEPKSRVEFYAWFQAFMLVHGSWKFNIIDVDARKTDELFDAFDWAQDNAYDGPDWNRFSFDLKAYEGKKVKFMFVYNFGGEDLAIDGFKLIKQDATANDNITVFEGEQVLFSSQVEGDPDTYEWTFDGGTPATASTKNPVVTYNQTGSYDVTLTIRRGEESATVTRKDFIHVIRKAPKARIGLPEEGYESPYVGVFIPVNVPVTFRDESTDNPTAWNWQFQNTDILTSTEQNPTVTYLKKGVTSVGLVASNEAGKTTDILTWAIQAGGAQYIWNINMDENKQLKKIDMSWFGNYAGSNSLDIDKFAEAFKAPLADAAIDSAAIFFVVNDTETPDFEIPVSVQLADVDGKPGDILASATIKAGDIRCKADTILATMVHFDKTAIIRKGQPFFITVGPFPNDAEDDIAIFCVRRDVGKKNTAWQYVADLDQDYKPTGTYQWFKNTDDPVSIAISPVLTYTDTATSIANPAESATPRKPVAVYTLSGQRVTTLQPGQVYIQKYSDGTSKVIGTGK